MLFAKMKHWQAFALLFIAPQAFLSIVFFVLVSEFDAETFRNVMFAVGVGNVLLLNCVFLWYRTVTQLLRQHIAIPDVARLIERARRVSVVVYLYTLAFMVFWLWLVSMTTSGISDSTASNLLPIIFLVLMVLHMGYIAGLVYCARAFALGLKSHELQRRVNFAEYVGEFFLTLFLPLGIWFIQPRINKMAEKQVDALRE